jgi:hypothetical protein
MTLAYVFWHWTAQPAPSYRERLTAFHRALAADPPRGFRRSFTIAIEGAPWVPRGSGFEDWYLVDDFGALGTLNDAAVSGSRRAPHDTVAVLAGGGTAGLYRLKSGELGEVAEAQWFSKPTGVSYDRFFDRLGPLVGRGALWQRQMTLGPTPEFCLQSAAALSLPADLRAVRVACKPV